MSAGNRSSSSIGKSSSELELPRRKRVQSAVEKRQSVNLSVDSSPWCSKVWGETSYHKDFPPKKPFPNQMRPSSVTRMHNPHPSQVSLITTPHLLFILIHSLFCYGEYRLEYINMRKLWQSIRVFLKMLTNLSIRITHRTTAQVKRILFA